MRTGKRKLSILLVLAMIVGLLGGIGVTASASESGWELSINQIILAAELNTDETRITYDGASYIENHYNAPKDGSCFAIVTMDALKSASASSLDLSKAALVISDAKYPCMADSSFLADHNYAVIKTELLTSDSGSIAFEIPDSYLDSDPSGWYVACGDIVSKSAIPTYTTRITKRRKPPLRPPRGLL